MASRSPLHLDTSVSPAKLQAAILILDKLFFMKTVVSNRKPQRTAGFFWAYKNKCPLAVEDHMTWGQAVLREHSFLSGTFLDFEDCSQPTNKDAKIPHNKFSLDHILKCL